MTKIEVKERADNWDHQFERDVASGKFASLAKEALGEYRLGKTRRL